MSWFYLRNLTWLFLLKSEISNDELRITSLLNIAMKEKCNLFSNIIYNQQKERERERERERGKIIKISYSCF